jgi:hypothetical protein
MTYEIYCPCKVKELGCGTVTGDFWPFFIMNWIHEGHKRGRCKFCGELLRVKGCECQQCTRPAQEPPHA